MPLNYYQITNFSTELLKYVKNINIFKKNLIKMYFYSSLHRIFVQQKKKNKIINFKLKKMTNFENFKKYFDGTINQNTENSLIEWDRIKNKLDVAKLFYASTYSENEKIATDAFELIKLQTLSGRSIVIDYSISLMVFVRDCIFSNLVKSVYEFAAHNEAAYCIFIERSKDDEIVNDAWVKLKEKGNYYKENVQAPYNHWLERNMIGIAKRCKNENIAKEAFNYLGSIGFDFSNSILNGLKL